MGGRGMRERGGWMGMGSDQGGLGNGGVLESQGSVGVALRRGRWQRGDGYRNRGRSRTAGRGSGGRSRGRGGGASASGRDEVSQGRPASRAREQFVNSVASLPEDRLAVVEEAAHGGVLGTLAGEHEDRVLSGAVGLDAVDGRRKAAGRGRTQRIGLLLLRTNNRTESENEA